MLLAMKRIEKKTSAKEGGERERKRGNEEFSCLLIVLSTAIFFYHFFLILFSFPNVELNQCFYIRSCFLLRLKHYHMPLQ